MRYRPDTRHADPITIGTDDVGDVLLVSVSGEIDLYSGSRLRAALHEAIDGAPCRSVVVDLTAVTLLSSTGCTVLVDALRQAQQRGRSFALVVDPASRAVPRTLYAAGLAGLFTTYDGVDEMRRRAAS